MDFISYIFLALLILVLAGSFYAWYHERRQRYKPYFKPAEYTLPDTQYPKNGLQHSVCLVGDTGNITDAQHDPVINLLKQWLTQTQERGTIIFLGDNIYPIGLPPEGHKTRAIAERRLKIQLDLVKDYPGRVYFISGNHDWNKGRENGLEYVLRQEAYIKAYLNRPDCYLPSGGCPGPIAIPLTENLVVIFINTQWWVQKGIRPVGATYNCTANSEADFFAQLEVLLQQHSTKQIIIAAHHPLYSNAMHGGKFTMKQHLFPLTAAHKRFYVPLPVAGSIYPVYRKLYGPEEDMSHPRYRRLRRKLLQIFHRHRNILYAAGHDHNLQYFNIKNNHYLVSGSGSKTAYVQSGGKSSFVHEHKGFFTIDYFNGNHIWLRAWEPPAPAPAATEKYTVAYEKNIA
jgi:hypothetical protein